MGLKDLFRGSGTRTRPLVLLEGETEVLRVTASARPGTLTSVGGDLVLTTRRLVFTPLETKDVVEVLAWGLEKAGAPGVVTGLPGRLGELVQQQQLGGAGGLRGIAALASGSPPSVLRPPTLLVRGTDGTTTEIGVLAGRRSPNWSKDNVPPRDHMVAALQGVLPV
jgi:hypothetical protein